MVELTYTDAQGVELGILTGYTLDMAWGVDENDFELKMGLSPRLEPGALIYADETEWGGIVDKVSVDETGSAVEVTYTGRTWHGILASHVLCPESGQAYLGYDHDANALVDTIVSNAGLGALFEVPTETVKHVKGRFYRYVSAWDGLKMELWRNGLRLDFRKQSRGKVLLQAVAATEYNDDLYSDRFPFEVEQETCHVNHLVCLGDGELGSREVVHLYADADGNVSKTQSITGLLERTEVYETSASESAEDPDSTLTAQGTAHLLELQQADQIEVSLSEELGAHVGDIVAAHSVTTPASVTGTVNKCILSVNGSGVGTLAYEVGTLCEDEEETA